MASSAYLRLLIFLQAILIPACVSSSPAIRVMYSAYKLNKQGDYIQPRHTPFPIWNQYIVPCLILSAASWSAYRFLRRQVRWSGIPISLKIFQNFFVIHKVKGFGVANKTEVDFFLEFSCFFDDAMYVGNLTSGSSAFSKSSLNIWKFLVQVLLKPSLENSEHYFSRVYCAMLSCPVISPWILDCQASLSMGILQERILEWVVCPPTRDLPSSGTEPRSPSLQEDFLPSEPPGKPKNTGMGSLLFLQWIFLSQDSNQGLLHCRQILYQLIYQGNLIYGLSFIKIKIQWFHIFVL